MPILIQYILKLSISLGIVFLFYQFLLRRLTFYNWNRWYLLGYTFLSFFIPFVNLSPVLERQEWADSGMIKLIPALSPSVSSTTITTLPRFQVWDACLLVLVLGMITGLSLFVMRYFSLLRIRHKAKLVSDGEIRLYDVNENIIPFSFGNAVYINSASHSPAELQEIVRHEFVHVKQKHTTDLLWAEFLCVINWFNPFSWLIRHVIRQNLEFIADSKALQQGIDRKEYQYLLLKVIGNHSYSIANNFNFSSLKKRIAMMNKIKSARVHLLKFLFIVPLLAVTLLAFRDRIGYERPEKSMNREAAFAGMVVDAVTKRPLPSVNILCRESGEKITTDQNGYFKLYVPVQDADFSVGLEFSRSGYASLNQSEHWANLANPAIYELFGNTVLFVGLAPASTGQEGFSFLSGNPRTKAGLRYEDVYQRYLRANWENPYNITHLSDTVPVRPARPVLPDNVKSIHVEESKATVKFRDGSTETYNLDNEKEKSAFENKYGALPGAPPAIESVPAVPSVPSVPPIAPALPDNVKSMDINNGKATVILKNGQKENYDLNDAKQKKEFENKYGEVLPPPAPPGRPVRVKSISGIDESADASQDSPGSPTTVRIRANTQEKPLFIIDGKPVKNDKSLDEIISPDEIQEIHVWKDESALQKYGEQGKNGVVEITTKNALSLGDFDGLLIIDGKEVPEGKKLADYIKSPDEIQSVNVLKGETAEKKYGAKAKNGVIEITRKKRETLELLPSPVSSMGTTVNDADFTGGELLFTITPKTTRADLDNLKSDLDAKGYTLKIENVNFNDGRLVSIRAYVNSKSDSGLKARFNGEDFSKIWVTLDADRQGRNHINVRIHGGLKTTS